MKVQCHGCCSDVTIRMWFNFGEELLSLMIFHGTRTYHYIEKSVTCSIKTRLPELSWPKICGG